MKMRIQMGQSIVCEKLSQFLLSHFGFNTIHKRLALAAAAKDVLQILYPSIGIPDLLFDFLFDFTTDVVGVLKGFQKLNEVVFLFDCHEGLRPFQTLFFQIQFLSVLPLNGANSASLRLNRNFD